MVQVAIARGGCKHSSEAKVVRSGGRGGGGRPIGYFAKGAAMIFLLVLAMQSTTVEAKRGCANFGHSCYGGMGKRTNDEFASQQENSLDGDADPALVFTGPRNPASLAPLLQQLQEQLQQQQQQEQEQIYMDKLSSNLKVSPYMKQLLRLYRNMQMQPMQLHHGLPEQ